MAIERDRQAMEIRFVLIISETMTFTEAILELKGSIQYIRKTAFIEIISLIKHLNVTTFRLKDTFSVSNTENILGQQ